MASVLIGYDLNKTGQDYTNLIDAIKKMYPNYWHCLDSTWIVKTEQTALQVCNAVRPHIDNNDELLCVTLTRDAAWVGFNDNCSNWLKNNL